MSIEWARTGLHSQIGRAGGFPLFSIRWGMERQDAMYVLASQLPVKSRLLGQHYDTQDAAKDAAEVLLAAFVKRITPAPEADQ